MKRQETPSFLDERAKRELLRHLHSPRMILSSMRRLSYQAAEYVAMGIVIGCSVGGAMVVFQRLLLITVGWVSPYLRHPLGTVLVPGVGLLLSGLVIRLMPETVGHGTDAIVESVHRRHAIVHILVSPVKMLASILTIGFGGSAGREGPAIQISGSIASNLGRLLRFRTIPLRHVVVSSISASFGSIFKAPMAGMIFGCEALYLRSMEYRPLLSCMFSSLFAYLTYTLAFRTKILFTVPVELLDYRFQGIHILYFIVFGFVMGIFSILYIATLHLAERSFGGLHVPLYVRTALGGVLTGMIGLAVLRMSGASITVMGMGINEVIRMFSESRDLGASVFLVLLVGKVLATSLTIGSGASGGLVMPTFFAGAAFGGLLGYLSGLDPMLLSIVGCLAFFGSCTHVPLAMTFFAAETFNFNYILPVAISVLVGSWVASSYSLYSSVAIRPETTEEE